MSKLVDVGIEGRVRQCDSDVNESCDQVDLQHSYQDHCSDPVIVWVFIIHDGQQVFSNPPSFHVACNNTKGVGYRPDADWQQRMEAAHINQGIIDKVRHYLQHHPPFDYERQD